jgi:hypothetical protein
MSVHLAAHERQHVIDDLVQVQPALLRFALRRELADSLDDVPCSVTVRHDVRQRVMHQVAVRPRLAQIDDAAHWLRRAVGIDLGRSTRQLAQL